MPDPTPTYAPITWDDVGERYYHYGVDHGVFYAQADNGTYPKGVAWNGLTAVNESPDGGDPNDLWADNIKYGSLRGAENFKGTIEAYNYPPEFAPCNGEVEAVGGVYLGQQKRKAFGFCYRTMIGNDTGTDTDDGYLLHLVYNATTTPTDMNYETINDNPDAITMSWDFDTTPLAVTGYKPTAHIIIDSRKADATKLGTLEDKLYGTNSADAYLPLPAEVITTLT